MTIAGMVRKKLEANPELRADDTKLIFSIWEDFGFRLTEEQRNKFSDICSAETIRRERQKLNEKGLLLPDVRVQKKRKALEKKIRQEIREEKLPILFTMPAPKTYIDPFTNS